MGRPRKEFTGVYMITCSGNKKVYIGSAVRISRRKHQHYNYLKNNKPTVAILQADYNTYGKEHIIHSVLELCPGLTKRELRIKESEWVDRYNARDSRYGYNTTDPVTGRIQSGDFANKKKPCTWKKRSKYNIEHDREGAPFFVINTTTGEVDLFMSMRFLKQVYSWHESPIRKCLAYWDTSIPENDKHGDENKKRFLRSHHGFMFVYAGMYQPDFDYIGYKKPVKQRWDQVPRSTEKKVVVPIEQRNLGRKEVKAINATTGEEQVFVSASECIKALGMKENKVYAVLQGIGKSHRGYRFEYTGVCQGRRSPCL